MPTSNRDSTDHADVRFSMDQINAMIPEIEATLTRVLQLQAHIETHKALVTRLRARSERSLQDLLSTMQDPNLARTLATLKAMQGLLDDEMDHLEDQGCVVRSIAPGIVEWPSHKDDGHNVLLGWRYGDLEVGYWREHGPGTELHAID